MESTDIARNPTWSEKVLALNAEFSVADIPYAFGGALSAIYYRDPRFTFDIDVNIFLPSSQIEMVANSLGELFTIDNEEEFRRDVQNLGQARTRWNDTPVDLFFADVDFHVAMSERVREVAFEGAQIPILSAEDIRLYALKWGWE